jgi:trimeric autotransporter adhesin
MESKKINQLATELTPALSDLTIIGDPTTGISKKITLSQMASLFTGTVEEYANIAAFPLVGVADTIYIALDTNVLYRWDTGLTSYVELSPNIINSLVFSDANGFDGNISLVGSVATLTITTALTTGSVGFIGASGALLQDNANFFWDDTNNRLGLGTNAPTTALDVFGSGIIGRINGTSTNNAFLGFASAGTNKWSIGNVQSDHRFRIYNEATASELVSVLSTGEFGIGISNPTTKFHIDGAASALIANLDADVSIAKSLSFRSDNSARINLEVSGTESGSNAGANLFIRRYSDAGALIDTPLTITRSTGAISLTTALSGTSATFGGLLTVNNAGEIIRLGTSGTDNYIAFRNSSNVQIGDIGFDSRDTDGLSFWNNITNGNLVFGAGGARRITVIGSNGNVGIGTATPFNIATVNLTVNGSSSAIQLGVSDVRNAQLYADGAEVRLFAVTNVPLRFGTNDIERMRITNYGVVAVNFAGSTSGGVAHPMQIKGATSNNQALWIEAGSTSDAGIEIAHNGTIGIISVSYRTAAGYTPLTFYTSGSERMRIAANGKVTITPTINGDDILNLVNASSSGYGMSVQGGNGGNYIFAARNYVGTGQFTVYGNGAVQAPRIGANTGTTMVLDADGYLRTSSSSIRYKKDIKPIDIGLDFILSLNPVSYNLKNDNTPQVGFIAEDFPDNRLVSMSIIDSTDKSKGYQIEGVNYAQIVAPLVKAIQEQQVQIEELKKLILNK